MQDTWCFILKTSWFTLLRKLLVTEDKPCDVTSHSQKKRSKSCHWSRNFVPKGSILVPKRYKSEPVEKVPSQSQLLNLFSESVKTQVEDTDLRNSKREFVLAKNAKLYSIKVWDQSNLKKKIIQFFFKEVTYAH